MLNNIKHQRGYGDAFCHGYGDAFLHAEDYGNGMIAGAMSPEQRALYKQQLLEINPNYGPLKRGTKAQKHQRALENERARKAIKVVNRYKKMGINPSAKQIEDELAIELLRPRKARPMRERGFNPNFKSAAVKNGIKRYGQQGYELHLRAQIAKLEQHLNEAEGNPIYFD